MKTTNPKLLALVLALTMTTFSACTSRDTPGSSTPESPTEATTAAAPSEVPSSASEENSRRIVTSTSELIGNPDRITLMVNEVESVFEPSSAEYAGILEILNNRMPDGFKEAASAFMWLHENQQDIDWGNMAQDFDYIRLSYSAVQEVALHCMAESYGDYALSADYQDIIFPLTQSELSGNPEMCILGNGAFLGILDKSDEVLSSLLSLSAETERTVS
jgi:hypothetical protein